MKKSKTLFYLLLLPAIIYAQNTQWVNFATDRKVFDVAFEGDVVWVAAEGGVAAVNRLTGERQLFQPWNSGLHGLDVRSIEIGTDGVKWIGSSAGLMRYDGTDWQYFFGIPTGDSLFNIANIKLSPNGEVWFMSLTSINGTTGNRFFSFDGTTFKKHNANLGVAQSSNSHVADFEPTQTGEIWVAKKYELLKYDGNQVLVTFDSTNSILDEGEVIQNIALDNDENLWVATQKYEFNNYYYRILKYDGNTWTVANILGGSTISDRSTIFKSATGEIWFNVQTYYHTTFARYDGSNWSTWNSSTLQNLPAEIQQDPDLLYVDQAGHWWLETNSLHEYTNNLFEFDGNVWNTYDTDFAHLPENSLGGINFDCNGQAWLGKLHYNGGVWTDYDISQIVPNGFVNATALDPISCDMWFGIVGSSNATDLLRFDGATFTPYEIPSFTGLILTLKVATDGTLWVGTNESKIWKFDGTTWTDYDPPVVAASMQHIDIDLQGNVWVCVLGNGIGKFDGNNWVFFHNSNSPVINLTSWLFADDNGFIWTESSSGIARYNGAGWQDFPTPFPSDMLTGIAQDQFHNYWIGTFGYGVFRFDGMTFTNYFPDSSPISTKLVTDVGIDLQGSKWFTHSLGGISVFNENFLYDNLNKMTGSLSGRVYLDTDQNGQPASVGEPGLPGQKVWLMPDSLMTFTNFDGIYQLSAFPGNHEVVFAPETPFVPTSPVQTSILMGSDDQHGIDFGAWAAISTHQVSVDLTASFARCNRKTTAWTKVQNLGLLNAEDIELSLQFDPLLIFESAQPTPTSIQGNTIKWLINDLTTYSNGNFAIVFQSPSVDHVGEILSLHAMVSILENGQSTQLANDSTTTVVICSFDPNDKKCEAVGDFHENLSLLTDPLDFTINFQNQGNDTAFIVIIRDTLDANLDPSTLEILNSSHSVRTELKPGGILTFIFEGINLPYESEDTIGSQGFVKYRIAPSQGLPDPTEITNTAHIYFDFNPPIITNSTSNILVQTLPIDAVDVIAGAETHLIIFPNPSNGDAMIKYMGIPLDETWEIQVHEIGGKLIRKELTQGEKVTLKQFPKGFYFVSAIWNGTYQVQKLIIQ